ncbi:RTA1 like protein-domain-containing protein [Penicillium pulvis]|uniref:RTA1 like protein-domain-containing protein n=1 Tax=Penicillium pulvis TaxID=1562058 RepID=UPI0025473189|nr:RTA1 like protein-domain-containing protein [Penicillium pulvis]KAJ5806624.1 RTA1 like protein-domain-containing protein [Penicillium pulvis]
MASTECELYLYTPSLALAVVAVIAFSGLAAVLCFRMIKTKTWSSIFFVLGAFAQLSGYTARVFSTQNPCNRVAYGIQSILLLLGPTLIMLSVNLTQTNFARALEAEQFCLVPIRWQKPLYLSLNTVLIILQAVGGIMSVASTSITALTIGGRMTIAIYVIQTVFWGFTFAENVCMTIRLGRQQTETSMGPLKKWKSWNQLFGLTTSIIGFGRNIMRLTMAGGIAFLIENEWPAYAFDGYQMIVVLGAWAIFYLPEKCDAVADKGTYRSLTRLEEIRRSPT